VYESGCEQHQPAPAGCHCDEPSRDEQDPLHPRRVSNEAATGKRELSVRGVGCYTLRAHKAAPEAGREFPMQRSALKRR
jgi:hypothetical protein